MKLTNPQKLTISPAEVGTHTGALAALKDIDQAQLAVKAFTLYYQTKHPNAVARITDDLDVLREFYRIRSSTGFIRRTTNPPNTSAAEPDTAGSEVT